MSEFNDVKNRYAKLREDERTRLRDSLIELLKDQGLKVVKSGGNEGKGIKNYGRKRFVKGFDLRNWKYVEVIDDKHFRALIVLNTPDIDPSSRNIHALYDRIGIRFTWFKSAKVGGRKDTEIKLLETEWIDTGVDLPLTDKTIRIIADLIEKGYEMVNGEKTEAFVSELDFLREKFKTGEGFDISK